MASTISITSMTVPNPLKQGGGVSVTGTASSNYTLVSVTASIFNTSGTALYTKNVVPGTLSYNLNNMDSYMLFNKLTPGDYSYTVWAADSSNSQTSYNNNFTVVAAATSTLSITSMTVTNPLKEGGGVNVTGTVSSNYTIVSVMASIVNSSGTAVYTKNAVPGALSYNLNNMDSYMLFNKLTPGDYSYTVNAEDSSSAKKSYNNSFTVVSAAASTLSITSMTVPNPLTQGKGVNVTGTVSSNYTITNVTASILNSNKTDIYTKSVVPGSLSYDVHGMDSAMLFDKLTPGDYSYVITASDSSSTQKSYNSNFTVVAGASSTLSITGSMSIPNPLTQGKGVNVTGTVSSNYTLTNVTASILNSNKTAVYAKSVVPGALSYDVHGMDSSMLFDQLQEGTYTYVVTATDSSGASSTLVNIAFAVSPSTVSYNGGVYALAGIGAKLSPAQQLSNANYILSYLINQGFTKNAACGAIGNMYAESKFNPGVWQSSESLTDPYNGYGLIQWTPPSKIICTNGIAPTAASANSLATSNSQALMDAELQFLLDYCKDGAGNWYQTLSYFSPYKMTFAEYIKSTYSASDLAKVFHASVERSADSETAIQNNRATTAQNFYIRG